jgi:flavin reductase (DIM6/NTAB) family NADH-FMN oxidoreductase RutF
MGGAIVARAPSGAPFLRDALGCLDLRVLDARSFASHTTFFCEVTDVAVSPEVLEGTASARLAEVLRMEDTKMNYGG